MEGIVIVHEEPLFLDWKCTIDPKNIPEWWHIKVPQGRYHVNPPTKHRLVLKQGNIKIESNKLASEAMDKAMCDNYNVQTLKTTTGTKQINQYSAFLPAKTEKGIDAQIKADVPYNTYYFLNPWFYNILPIPMWISHQDGAEYELARHNIYPGTVAEEREARDINGQNVKPRYYPPNTRWEFDPNGKTAQGEPLALGSIGAYRDVFPWSEMFLEAKSASSLQPDRLDASFHSTQYVPGTKVGKLDAFEDGMWQWTTDRHDDDFNFELPHHDAMDLYFRVADSRGNSLKLLMQDMPREEKQFSIFSGDESQPKGKTIACQFALVYQKYTVHAEAPNHERGGFTGYYKTAITDQHAV